VLQACQHHVCSHLTPTTFYRPHRSTSPPRMLGQLNTVSCLTAACILHYTRLLPPTYAHMPGMRVGCEYLHLCTWDAGGTSYGLCYAAPLARALFTTATTTLLQNTIKAGWHTRGRRLRAKHARPFLTGQRLLRHWRHATYPPAHHHHYLGLVVNVGYTQGCGLHAPPLCAEWGGRRDMRQCLLLISFSVRELNGKVRAGDGRGRCEQFCSALREERTPPASGAERPHNDCCWNTRTGNEQCAT